MRTTGHVTVFGKNVYDADVSLGELRKKVGMVFQRPNPLPLSIYENVPHLLVPVVTAPKKAAAALSNIEREMDLRYLRVRYEDVIVSW